MRIHFATDHAGFELKEQLTAFVRDELGYEIVDHGAFEYDDSDDYPDFMKKAGAALSAVPADRAIVLGGSGQGEAMVLNRMTGVRAAVYYGGPMDIIKLSREHNDANALSLGARFLDIKTAREVVQTWLETSFSGDERHVRRLNKLDDETL